MRPVSGTALPLRMIRRGKVRDVYEVDRDTLLLVATDRVSAFDVVMAEAIPHKGKVLTQLTVWWLAQLDSIIGHHMISAEFSKIVDGIPELADFADDLSGRVMLCKRADVFPVECVIRGYMAGSAWKEYRETGLLAGEPLPGGLRESDQLPEPLFSPATKAEEGHDENIPVSRMSEDIGDTQTAELERLSRLVYGFGSRIAERRGIIIADTKMEFGYLTNRDDGGGMTDEFDPSRVILVDEVLTPDSSRFWPADQFEPGRSQPSFDKQPLRDYLDGERQAGRWNGDNPPPLLPPEVVEATSQRYLDIFRLLTLAPLDIGASL